MNVVLYKSVIARVNVYDFTTKLDKRMTVRRIYCCIRLHSAAILTLRTKSQILIRFDDKRGNCEDKHLALHRTLTPRTRIEVFVISCVGQYRNLKYSITKLFEVFREVLWHLIETKIISFRIDNSFYTFIKPGRFFVLFSIKRQFSKFKNIYCNLKTCVTKGGLSDFNNIISGLITRDDLMPTLFDY